MKKLIKKIKLLFNSLFWLDLRYKLSCQLKSHQNWLVKEIPRGFSSFSEINKVVNFKMFLYLTEEIQIGSMYTWDSNEELKALKKLIDETYKIIRHDIPLLEKEERSVLEEQIKNCPDVKSRISSMFDEHIENGEKFYTIKESDHMKNMTRINKEIKELENKALVNIAEIMPYMDVVSEDGRRKSKNSLASTV